MAKMASTKKQSAKKQSTKKQTASQKKAKSAGKKAARKSAALPPKRQRKTKPPRDVHPFMYTPSKKLFPIKASPSMTMTDLHAIAAARGIAFGGLTKAQLIKRINES